MESVQWDFELLVSLDDPRPEPAPYELLLPDDNRRCRSNIKLGLRVTVGDLNGERGPSSGHSSNGLVPGWSSEAGVNEFG